MTPPPDGQVDPDGLGLVAEEAEAGLADFQVGGVRQLPVTWQAADFGLVQEPVDDQVVELGAQPGRQVEGRLGGQDHLQIQLAALAKELEDTVVRQVAFVLRQVAVGLVDHHVDREAGVVFQAAAQNLLEQQRDQQALAGLVVLEQ